jgi:hypothetical protein
MKKLLVLPVFVLLILFSAVTIKADMACYLNCGVSNTNPTIGLNVEYQYGYASIALGAGIMAFNDFGLAAGVRGYLFGLDGGPYFEVVYGTTGEKPNVHTDSYGKEVVDSVDVFQGISTLAGWRFFFGDGWNMTFGAGAATMFPKHGDFSKTLGKFVFNVTAGIMFWGDEAAAKNAEKYAKSFVPPEPGDEYSEPEMPDGDEAGFEKAGNEDTPVPDMLSEPELLTTTADVMVEPAPEAVTAPAAVTGAAGTK